MDLLDEINKCHQLSGVDAYTRDVLSRCHREIRQLRAKVPDPSVNRLYRAINGLDGDDADKRAEDFIYSHIDGWIPASSRALVKLALAQNFEELYQRVALTEAALKSQQIDLNQ